MRISSNCGLVLRKPDIGATTSRIFNLKSITSEHSFNCTARCCRLRLVGQCTASTHVGGPGSNEHLHQKGVIQIVAVLQELRTMWSVISIQAWSMRVFHTSNARDDTFAKGHNFQHWALFCFFSLQNSTNYCRKIYYFANASNKNTFSLRQMELLCIAHSNDGILKLLLRNTRRNLASLQSELSCERSYMYKAWTLCTELII